jgi:hypothetical protein
MLHIQREWLDTDQIQISYDKCIRPALNKKTVFCSQASEGPLRGRASGQGWRDRRLLIFGDPPVPAESRSGGRRCVRRGSV